MVRLDGYRSDMAYNRNNITEKQNKKTEQTKSEFQKETINISTNTADSEKTGVLLSISEEAKLCQKAEETTEEAKLCQSEENPEEQEETEETKETKEESTETQEQKGKIGVNAGKRARQIAAAKTQAQLRSVIDLLMTDLQECEAGLKEGMCDEAEIEKVKALIGQAQGRMGQVRGDDATPQEEMAFSMASLL